MKTWILRYPGPRERGELARDLEVLERSDSGEESELETLRVEFRESPLSQAVVAQVEQGRDRLVLDLVHEKHMDSNDLAQTLEAFKQAKELGAELVIANSNSKIQEIFRITNLDQVVSLFDSLEAAIEHLASTN